MVRDEDTDSWDDTGWGDTGWGDTGWGDTGWGDDEFPEDIDDFDTVPCPHCGAEIHEDSPRCPICGDYIIATSRRIWDGKPLWYILLGVIGILAVFGAMLLVR